MTKNKGGRPTKYEGLDLEQVEVLAREGWTDSQMAAFFGVAESTWHLWKTKHTKFSESLRSWKEFADEKVERSLYERACGYTHKEEKVFCSLGEIKTHETLKHYPPDSTAMIYWLKNRQPEKWRDKQQVDNISSDGSMTPETTININKEDIMEAIGKLKDEI